MRASFFVSVLFTPLLVLEASAGSAEVKACSKNLPPQAQLILKTLVPKLASGGEPSELMKSTVIGLVQSGEIERASARDNALSAAECLRKMQPE